MFISATTTTILKNMLDSRMCDAKIICGRTFVLISDTLISGTQPVGTFISETHYVSTIATVLPADMGSNMLKCI